MIKINENNLVNAKDLYLFVEVKTKFPDWIKNGIKYADFKENVDFFQKFRESSGGRRAVDYEFTIQAAKELCILSRTEKAKELRRWLISLSEKIENKEYLSEKQIIALSALIGFFKYVENQKEIEEIHKDNYVKNNPGEYSYVSFHLMRNRMLNISQKELTERIKNFCIDNMKKLPKLQTKQQKVLFLDMFDGLKNAVWDFLYLSGETDAIKLAELAKKMAKAQGLQILDKNESNIFQTKELLSKPVYTIEKR